MHAVLNVSGSLVVFLKSQHRSAYSQQAAPINNLFLKLAMESPNMSSLASSLKVLKKHFSSHERTLSHALLLRHVIMHGYQRSGSNASRLFAASNRVPG